MKKLKFKAARQEQEVEIEDAQGQTKLYKLIEFSGTERTKYKSRFTMDIELSNGVPTASMNNYNPMSESEFVSLCLFDNEGKSVSEDEINKLPGTVIVALYEAALTLCGLNKEANEEAKND